jgi:hypothetical protein
VRLLVLELPPIGWQLFILGSSQSDSTAFPSFLDTYATRLLAEALSPCHDGGSDLTSSGDRNHFAFYMSVSYFSDFNISVMKRR